ncbi:MAG: methyl-accepting chemotaxis protein [Vulcanimicrobiaceae bacterium]
MLRALSNARRGWPVGLQIGLTLAAVALGCAIAWYGAALPVEVLLVAVAAIAAALLGFPTGPAVAVASAAVLHYARIDQHAGDPVTGPFFLLVAGVAVSVLFYGTPGSLKPAGGSVEDPDPRRALAPGRASPEDLEPSAYFRGLAALTAGVRELSHGDFTKHVDASDPGLRELAIALNEMLFTMRDFLTDLRRSAGQLSVAGAELTQLASGAVATAAQAAAGTDRIAAELHERLSAIEGELSPVAAPALAPEVVLQRATVVPRVAGHIENSAARVLGASDALSRETLQAALSATSGSTISEATVEEARALELAVAELSSDLERLCNLSAEIETATRVLERVGERTSFIALNASIQAGRGGREAGAFVTIVDEIRTLAETNVMTNREIGRASEKAQRIVTAAASAAARLAQRAAVVSSNASAANEAMREIAASSDSVQQRVAEMSVTARVLRAASERAVIGGTDDAPSLEPAPAAPATATSNESVVALAAAQARAFAAVAQSNDLRRSVPPHTRIGSPHRGDGGLHRCASRPVYG